MATLLELNATLNRVLRQVNALAVDVAGSKEEAVRSALPLAVAALSKLAELQGTIHKASPDLEYHYDEQRPPTRFMIQVAELVKDAEKALARGDNKLAAERLKAALALEPPPFAYEAIDKKLAQVPDERS